MVQQRALGDGPLLTVVGLGTWAIGGPWRYGWGAQDDLVSVKTIERAVENGVNWLDTAPAYGLGHAETVIGNLPSSLKRQLFIATKCGIVWDEERKVSFQLTPASIREECEQSLRRLKIDQIDLYQIHWPDKKGDLEQCWAEMDKLKDEGKVRYIGASNFTLNQLASCETISHITSYQPPYNLLRREAEHEGTLDWCKRNNTGVIAYSPMQSGLLTDSFTRQYLGSLPKKDWRKRDYYFREPYFSKALKFREEIGRVAKRYGKGVSAFAVAWVLANNAVSSAIVGCRTPEQAEVMLAGGEIEIVAADLEEIDALYLQYFGSM